MFLMALRTVQIQLKACSTMKTNHSPTTSTIYVLPRRYPSSSWSVHRSLPPLLGAAGRQTQYDNGPCATVQAAPPRVQLKTRLRHIFDRHTQLTISPLPP